MLNKLSLDVVVGQESWEREGCCICVDGYIMLHYSHEYSHEAV